MSDPIEVEPVPKTELRVAIEALPVYTLVSIGRRMSSGRVQGSLHMRTRDGLRYVGRARDNWELVTLHQETSGSNDAYDIVTPEQAS